MNLIGISGKKGHGKDTVAKIIQIIDGLNVYPTELDFKSLLLPIEYLKNPNLGIPNNKYKIKKFADKLKDMVCVLLGCTREQLEDPEFKEKPLGEEWDVIRVTSSWGAPDKLLPVEGENMMWTHAVREQTTPRKILQLMGTECGREILHPEIWVLSTFADYKTGHVDYPLPEGHLYGDKITFTYKPSWIITDVRFLNEARAVKDKGGVVIRVNNERIKSTDTHESETALDDYEDWDAIINNTGNFEQLTHRVEMLCEDILGWDLTLYRDNLKEISR